MPTSSHQPLLDVHVDVFQAVVEHKLTVLDLPLDPAQALDQDGGLLLGDDAGLGQHAAVGDAALDVVAVEAPVDVDGGGKGLHRPIGFFGKSSLPRFFGHVRLRSYVG